MTFRPTNELRYVLRYQNLMVTEFTPVKTPVRILQQKWIDDDPNDESLAFIEEWRDIPFVVFPAVET